MINFFICSYFEGHWIINTKKNKKQNPNFLRVEYYLIRESPTSVFWSQTSVRVDVHTCEMWWYLVLPPPTCTPLPAGPEKEPRGRLPIFLQGLPSLQDLWVGWTGLHAAFFPSLLLFSWVFPPLHLSSHSVFLVSSCFQPQTLIKLQINPLQTLRQYNSFQKMIRGKSLLWKGTFISSLTKWPAIYFSLILPISHFTSNQVRPWFGSTQYHLRPMYPFFFLPSSLCRISHRSNLKGNPGLIWLKHS